MNNVKKCVFTPHRNKSKNNRLEWIIMKSDRADRSQVLQDGPRGAWCEDVDRDYAISEILKEGYIVEVHPYIREEGSNE
tara:strand:- start:257 stop:493 length:237 start_codon:yes stop_codon:yes gene_type:complete